MYDLMFLAFQTDTTRVATYQISQEDGKGVSDKFPAIAARSDFEATTIYRMVVVKRGGTSNGAQYDQFLARQHAYFLKRLKDTQEGEGNLLDNTVSLYEPQSINLGFHPRVRPARHITLAITRLCSPADRVLGSNMVLSTSTPKKRHWLTSLFQYRKDSESPPNNSQIAREQNKSKKISEII